MLWVPSAARADVSLGQAQSGSAPELPGSFARGKQQASQVYETKQAPKVTTMQ